MNATLAREQLNSFKIEHKKIADWLGELSCEQQAVVLSDLFRTEEMIRRYPDLCKGIDFSKGYTRSCFAKPDTSVEGIVEDLNVFYGATENIPVETREILIESRLLPQEETAAAQEEGVSLDALSEPATPEEEECDGNCCGNCTCESTTVAFIFKAGNNTFKIEAGNRDQFVSLLTAKVVELKRNGYADDQLPQSFRNVGPEFMKIIAGTIYDQKVQEMQADAAALPHEEYAAKKSTGGSH